MLKALLPKGEKPAHWADLGACLDYARRDVGWTVDELAGRCRRDSKQVARWIRGEEQTQVGTLWAVEELRAPFVIKLALLAQCEVETTVRIKRRT